MSSWRRFVWLLMLVPPTARGDAGRPGNLAPTAALQSMQNGNARFIAGKPNRCQTDEHVREKLAAGQAPHAIVLTCSDSRVPPERIFDQGLGDLFVIRVAGNVLDTENIGSIEYAVERFGVRLIVIMGHDSCGAVKAALDTPKGGDAGSPSINALVAEIQANLGAQPATSDPTLRGPVKRNVDAVASGLLRRSPIVRQAAASGQVKVLRALYELDSGQVELWSDHAPE